MEFLILNSPIYREHSDTNEDYLPPLGLCYIATHLNEAGINAEIVDCVSERLGVVEIFDLVIKRNPCYLAMNIFTQNMDIVKEITENCPIMTKIILGGQVTKSIYTEILNWDIRNELIIVIGESELIMPDIVKGCCNQDPIINIGSKLVYKIDDSSPYFPKDLSKVHIDRQLLKNDIITNHYNEDEFSIVTSRGCTYDCAFCGAARSMNCDSKVRCRSIFDIEDEIYSVMKNHPNVSSVRILDDLFLRNIESIKKAINLFKKYDNLSWRGMAHILTFERHRNIYRSSTKVDVVNYS
jgi:radical SAM superfamily enzyme YgiQ (UPF0313 family)